MNTQYSSIPILFTILCYCLYCTQLISQSTDLQIEAIPIESGISDLRVTAIIQDRQGFMWFGTHDGLNRYDGYEYKVYRHDPLDSTSLPGNYIEELYLDSQGNIWVALQFADIGLCRYDPQTDKFVPYAHNPNDNNTIGMKGVLSIGETSDGYLWFGSGKVLDRMDPVKGTFKHFRHEVGDKTTITPGGIFLIYEDRRGVLWIGTGAPWNTSLFSGLNRYDPKTETFTRFQYDPTNPLALKHPAVMSALEDSRGNFWVGTGSGLHLMDRDKGTFTYFPYDPANPNKLSFFPHAIISPSIYGIYEDYLGRLWFAGDGGIVVYDPDRNSVIRYRPDKGNENDSWFFWELAGDRSGNIWLGSGHAVGLHKVNLNPRIFKELWMDVEANETIKDSYVYSFTPEGHNRSWLSTNQGLYLYNQAENVIERSIPVSDNTYVIEKQGSNILWYGGHSGLYRYDLKKRESARFPINRLTDFVLSIQESTSGSLWIGTYGNGIFRLDPGRDDFVHCAGHVSEAQCLIEDRSGHLWAGGANGLFRYNVERDQWERVLEGHVNTVFEYSQGSFWIGTTGEGLWHYDQEIGAVEKFTPKEGLPANSIFAITEDQDGAIWMTTNRKIVKFSPKDKVFQNFDARDGVLNEFMPFTSRAVTEDLNGNIFFGGKKGITKIFIHDVQQIKTFPQIALTRVQISEETIPLLYQPPSLLEFSHDQNNLIFEYVGLHYSNPSRNQYRYFLENFDVAWLSAGTDRNARYTNLDPGQYTFRVKAASNEGIWSEEATLDVVIHPPWWATTRAYILYVLLVLVILYLIRRFILRRQERRLESEKQKLERERQVNEQLRRVDALKDQFLANTSHELRTPLQGIIGLSESLLERMSEADQKEDLSMIVSSGKRLSNLVNDILDFSKLKNYDIQLLRRPVNLRVLADIVLRNNAPLIKGKDLELINEIPAELPAVNGDENRLQQVLYNLIGNAIKFTERGYIRLRAQENKGFIQVSVEDTGIGIPENKRKAIFQEFEQGDGSISREFTGTGLGLSISKRLVELHGGTMWVESTFAKASADGKSEIGKGSAFFFTLPVSTEKATTLNPEVLRDLSKPSPKEEKPSPFGLTFLPQAKALTIPSRGGDTPRTPLEGGQEAALIRILVVDDEPINQQVLKNHLSGKGYHLTQALNGEEAIRAISDQEAFDLVLLDLMMPRMSGYEVCHRIREKYLPSELPIIMVTAKNQLKDIVQGLSIGANDYLPKPFHKEELLARINTQLDLHNIFDVAGRFVPSEFLRSLNRNRLTEVVLGDHAEQEVTVLFSDIRDYTTLAESMTPEENFKFINAFHGRMGPIVKEHNGFINQYLGDAIMAIFPKSPEDALHAAIAMHRRLVQYNQQRNDKGKVAIKMGVGLHTGSLIMGIIGDKGRMDAATIADTVNTASRIENLTKYYGTSILLTEDSFQQVANRENFHFRYLGKVQVKGKKEPVGLYECYSGDSPQSVEKKLGTEQDFEKGLTLFFEREFAEASATFNRILKKNNQDHPARLFMHKSSEYLLKGVPDDWTGVEIMTFK